MEQVRRKEMLLKRRTAERILLVLFAGMCAFLALMIASTCSPLYATNFWTDTNLYFTIGRGMLNGKMPYRDLFDHKGPVLYFLYACAAFISDKNFSGVFFIEICSLTLTLLFSYRIVSLFGNEKLRILTIPVMACVIATATAFNQGGSAEEFILPALTASMYYTLSSVLGDQGRQRNAFIFGLAAAYVFLVKYTDIGLFIGIGLIFLVYECHTAGIKNMFRVLMWMVTGFGIFTGIIAVILYLCGILGPCVEVYFFQNLFSYSGKKMTLIGHIFNALAYLRTQGVINPAVLLVSFAGIIWMVLFSASNHKRGWIEQVLFLPVGAGCLLLTCYWGEIAHPYYALVFAACCPPGLAFLSRIPVSKKMIKMPAVSLLAAALLIPCCLFFCQAVPMLTVEKAAMPQNIFADIMRSANASSLLDITSLDQGFYLASGIEPNVRYFADNNLQTGEKEKALADYLSSGEIQYVVTRYRNPGNHYVKIAEVDGYFDLYDLRTYSLYQLTDKP